MNELLVKDRIDELMKALNLSQADFARRVGVTPNAITNWKIRGIKGSAFEKIATAFPNVNMNWLKTGEGEILLERMEKVRPHIPVEVAAGTLSGFSEAVKAGDCEMLPVVSAFPSYDYTMTIKGDSMEPKFEGGDMIAIRKTIDFIEWGKTYVLDTSDGAIIKRIYNEGDFYRCVSFNKEYPDFLVPKNSVFGIFKVVGLIRI